MSERDSYLSGLNYLSRREHSRRELFYKLHKKGYDETFIEASLDQLTAEGYLNEGRYVEAYVRSQVARGQGPLRIQQALKQRGIAMDQIQQYVYQADIDWPAQLSQCWQKRWTQQPTSTAERARQVRFLQQRGFALEMICQLLNR